MNTNKKLVATTLFISAFSATNVSALDITSVPADPGAGNRTVDAWYTTLTTSSGTTSIVDLTGAGGTLESGQPLPTGALRLTTINDNNSRAEVRTFRDFGFATDVLANLSITYDYYKVAPSANLAAAPAIRIEIAGTGTGDNYGQLIYEPYWNQPGFPGAAVDPAPNTWNATSVSPTSGQWWWNGGFELPNGFGGPPFNTLAGWLTAFQSSDPTDFATAHVISLGIGIGSFNPDQINYVDDVSVTLTGTGAFSQNYNFQVPEPTSLGLLGLGAMVIGRRRIR